jgi:predicted MFS family arabinose efflux permease
MAGLRMAAPLLCLRLGLGAASVGVLLSLFAFVQLFLAIPAGRFADRSNLKRPVTLAMFFAALGAGLAAAWPFFPTLCLAAMLCGGATGAVVITIQRYAGRLTDDPVRLRQIFSWISVAPAIANFAGPFLAGQVIDHAGFRACFGAMAALALCAWLAVRKAPDSPPEARPAGEQAQGSAWDLLADPRLRRLLLVNWLLTSCWEVHTFVLPVLGHERAISASIIGTILGLFAVAATVVRLILPVVVARVKEWALIT